MKIAGSTVLVTGANRGIGLAFAKEALARGAKRVYAGARDPSSIKLEGVTAIKLDVNSPADVAKAAAMASDTSIVINNAGIANFGGVLTADAEQSIRQHLETNLFGVLRVSQAFAPILARQGGGAFLNVASVVSWISGPMLASYAVSKSAVWSLSNALRNELREQGTQVTTLHMGFVDTDLTHGIDGPKSTPEAIVKQALDGLEAGALEVAADDMTRQVKQSLSSDTAAYLAAR